MNTTLQSRPTHLTHTTVINLDAQTFEAAMKKSREGIAKFAALSGRMPMNRHERRKARAMGRA